MAEDDGPSGSPERSQGEAAGTATPPTSRDEPALHPDPWRALCNEVGPAFAAWVLNCADGEPTRDQAYVAQWILGQVTNDATLADFPPHIRLHFLLGRADSGQSVATELRRICGKVVEPAIEETPDSLLNAIRHVAAECYGELLLSPSGGAQTVTTPYWSPHAKSAAEMLRSEFPTIPSMEANIAAAVVLLSTGSGGTVQAEGIIGAVIGFAWERLSLERQETSLAALLAALPESLELTRRLLNGSPGRTLGAASLTGVLPPSTFRADLGWGVLRSLWAVEQPELLMGDLRTRLTSQQHEDGSTVTIQDAGDLILIVDLPIEATIAESFDHTTPSLRTHDELAQRLDQVRLAYLLAGQGETPPVLLPVWRRIAAPLLTGSSMGWNDPQQGRGRTPTALSDQTCVDWVRWIGHLDDVPSNRVRAIYSRLLRATTENRDAGDTLIDAVIVWEALFGTHAEVTFRVTASLARLLEGPGRSRQTLQSELARVYDTRSRLVHGAEVDPAKLHDASTRALSIAVEAVRQIVTERADLLDLDSTERSKRILLE